MKDIEGNGIVHLSAMRLHTNVLEYLIESDYEEVPVWKILVGEWGTSQSDEDSVLYF